MKRYLSTFCFILLSSVVFSNEYHQMITSSNKWNYVSELWPTCIGCGGETKTHSYFVTGDTTISHHSYKKIMCAEIRYNGIDTMFFCAAREDTVNQIVYIKYGDLDERMLYSFKLDPGARISSDTSYVGEKISSITDRIVKSVDSYDINGFTGKKISVSTIYKHSNMNFVPFEANTEVWYEGIGQLTSFFGLYNDNDILCYWNDGNQIYSNPERNACVITEYRPHSGLDQPSQISGNTIKAYTSEGRLIVEAPANDSRLEVYSIDGSIRQTCFAQAGQIVKTSPLTPGLYIYKVIDKNGSVIANNKIVVN